MIPAQTHSAVSRTAPPPAPPGRVVVVGTGVVGLATALGCAQLGLGVDLVGPAPRAGVPRPAGAAAEFDARIYAISAGARALLERQRVWPQVPAARLAPVLRMAVAGDAGGQLQFDALASGVDSLATIAEESELLRALWLACALAPAVRHVDAVLASAAGDAAGVLVTLGDGRALVAGLLLGADGKHSAVRAAVGINARTTPYGHTAVVANFVCERPHDGTAYQWFTGDEGIIALLPLPGNHVSLVWSAPTALAAELAALPGEGLAASVQERSAGVLGRLQLIGRPQSFVLNRIVVDRLVAPRVALLGDAAHVVHPLAGQGLNLGLQDVSDLLSVLAARESWREPGDPVVLRRYERARAEPIGLMRGTVDSLARLFGSHDPALRRLRNWGLSAVNGIAPVKHALIRHALG